MNLRFFLTRGKSRSHICGHPDCDRLYVVDGPFADAALARAAARVEDASETVVRVKSAAEIAATRARGVTVFMFEVAAAGQLPASGRLRRIDHVTEGMF